MLEEGVNRNQSVSANHRDALWMFDMLTARKTILFGSLRACADNRHCTQTEMHILSTHVKDQCEEPKCTVADQAV